MCTKCCCSNCAATYQKCPLGVKPDANQIVNDILGLGGEAFKWVFNMYDKCYIPSLIRLVEKAMKKAHRPVWRPVGPMAVPTFTTLAPSAPSDEEGPHQATWNIFIVSCWSKSAQVGRARRGGRQCVWRGRRRTQRWEWQRRCHRGRRPHSAPQ